MIPPFNDAAYSRLSHEASPRQWGDVLARYTIFQQLKRRAGEAPRGPSPAAKAYANAGGARRIGRHRHPSRNDRQLFPRHPLDRDRYPRGQGSGPAEDLDADRSGAPQNRLQAAGEAGPNRITAIASSERSWRIPPKSSGISHCAVVGLQLAGAAKRKLETAAALYLSTPTQIMTKSEKRKLLLRIATAQSLQAEADDWVETLRASGLG